MGRGGGAGKDDKRDIKATRGGINMLCLAQAALGGTARMGRGAAAL